MSHFYFIILPLAGGGGGGGGVPNKCHTPPPEKYPNTIIGSHDPRLLWEADTYTVQEIRKAYSYSYKSQ